MHRRLFNMIDPDPFEQPLRVYGPQPTYETYKSPYGPKYVFPVQINHTREVTVVTKETTTMLQEKNSDQLTGRNTCRI
jgi:hypothetical protein